MSKFEQTKPDPILPFLKKHWVWIIAGIILFVIFFYLFSKLLPWLYPLLGSYPKPFNLKLATIILSGFGTCCGLYFTWRRIRAMENRNAIAQTGQIAEGYSRAIDNLSSDNLEARVSGILELEKIAKKSPEHYHMQIMQVLTTFVRNNAPVKSKLLKAFQSFKIPATPEDIQAILTVLGRRKRTYENGEDERLDLRKTDLRGADLKEANFQGVNLSQADLTKAILFKTKLQKANFNGANLQQAKLGSSELQGADFTRANLWGANLVDAKMMGAILFRTNLEGTNLALVDLQKGYLGEANLEDADFYEGKLQKAKDLSIEQLCKAKTLHDAKLDNTKCLMNGKKLRASITVGGKKYEWDYWEGGDEILCREGIERMCRKLLQDPNPEPEE